MDRGEASALARTKVRELQQMTRAELRDRYLGKPETDEVEAESGTSYQLETLAVWDQNEDGDLRVFVAVDDGGWRAIAPLSETFVVAPDGTFVDEAAAS